MSNEQKSQDQQQGQQRQDLQQDQTPAGGNQQRQTAPDFDGLKGKKPEDLTPEELRWMADTMPGDGPGD